MSSPFLKLLRSEKADYLQRNHPNAFLLLSLIARRARWHKEPSLEGIQQGEAMIGDYKNAGLSTKMEYRWAKSILSKMKIITLRTTPKGTIAKLCDSSIYDLNPEGQQHPEQHTHNTLTTPNKERKKEKKEEYTADSAEFGCASKLYEAIHRYVRNPTEALIPRWCPDFKTILKRKSKERIEEVIAYLPRCFYTKNVQSARKFDQEFERIEGFMDESRSKKIVQYTQDPEYQKILKELRNP